MPLFARFSTILFRSPTMARGSSNKHHGTWTRSHSMDCGGCSSTTETMVRNTADCFRSGDWVYTILNSWPSGFRWREMPEWSLADRLAAEKSCSRGLLQMPLRIDVCAFLLDIVTDG